MVHVLYWWFPESCWIHVPIPFFLLHADRIMIQTRHPGRGKGLLVMRDGAEEERDGNKKNADLNGWTCRMERQKQYTDKTDKL